MRQFRKPTDAIAGKQLAGGTVTALRTEEDRCGEIVLRGAVDKGTCINCPDMPCVFFDDSEITSPVLSTFPFSRSRDVCPFEALSADMSQCIPVINAMACIGCGLCISRCPANAIYIKNGAATLNNAENTLFRRQMPRDMNTHRTAVERLRAGVWEGSIRTVNEDTLAEVIENIGIARLSNTKQKLLVRNLLLCLGAEAAVSTVGDTNIRIDMWWVAQRILWVTEVDFDEVSLIDSPRALLDDVAVCVSRHNVPRETIGAAIICKEFPNKRSDFYHLIQDFESVVDLRIRTLSLAGLLLLVWTHRNIDAIDIVRDCNATRDNEGIVAAFSKLVPKASVLQNRYFMATK